MARAWIGREFEKPGRVFLGVVHRLDRPPHLWEMAIHQFDLLRFLFDTEVAPACPGELSGGNRFSGEGVEGVGGVAIDGEGEGNEERE